MIKKSLLVVMLSVIGWAQINAQHVLSLDSCVSMALQNNKAVRSSQLMVEQSQHTRKAYWANYFPNFSAIIADAYGTTEGTLDVDVSSPMKAGFQSFMNQYGTGLAQNYPALAQMLASLDPNGLDKLNPSIDYKMGNVFMGAINLEQPIYMGGKITAAYKMSKLGEQMARQGVELSHDEVVVQTYEAYALLSKAYALRVAALQYDSLLTALQTDVEHAKNRGLATNNDLLKVQVKKNEAELQVRQAENGIRLASMNLCHCIGLPLTTQVAPEQDGMKQDFVSPSSRDLTVTGRPEYQYLEMKSELAAQQVKLERSAFLPQVGLVASASYANGIEVMGKKFFGGDGYKNKIDFAVMASVKVPIYHANEAQHKVKAARLSYERSLLEQEDLVEKMNLELQQAANNLDEGILEAELADRSLDQAAENLRASQNAYSRGAESLSDVLTAQTLWQKAASQQVIARTQLLVLNVKFRKAAGQLQVEP